MVEFEYRGIGPDDAAVQGKIPARDHEDANRLLKEMQVRVSELRPVAPTSPTIKSISRNDFNMINEQLVAMVKAGVPLEEGFKQLAGDLAKPRLRKLVNELSEDLAAGTSLEDAIQKRHQAFPMLYARIIAVGMKTGKLAVVLSGFTRYLEFLGSMRRTIWEAVYYPLTILLVWLGILWFLTRTIGPNFRDIFHDFGTTLPNLTVLALDLGDNLSWIFPTSVAVVVGIVLLIKSARWPGARRAKEQIYLRIPVAGPMMKNCLIARFTQGLAMMVRCGIPMDDAVTMAGQATGSPTIIADSKRICDALTKGESVHKALQLGQVLPKFLGQMMQIAIDRNQLHECLEELSQLYDQRATHSLSTLNMILMPLGVILMGCVIGMYVLAMFLPMVKLIGSVTGGK
jgi:type II secretory pathway component PulF